MNFVVEDGTSKTDATSYATVAQYIQYWEDRGTSITTLTDQIQAYLNKATEYIDLNYNFRGYKTDEDQALEFPRYQCEKSVYNGYTDYYDSDEMPQCLINATCYLAAKATNELDAIGSNLRSVTYGSVSKTYSGSSTIKKYKVVDKMLRDIITHGIEINRVY